LLYRPLIADDTASFFMDIKKVAINPISGGVSKSMLIKI